MSLRMKKQKYIIFTRLFCAVSRNTENTQRTATKQNKTIFSIEIHCTQNMSREITNVCSELFSVIFVPLKYIADRTMFSSTKHPIMPYLVLQDTTKHSRQTAL